MRSLWICLTATRSRKKSACARSDKSIAEVSQSGVKEDSGEGSRDYFLSS